VNPEGTINSGQSRETGNIGCTNRRKQRKNSLLFVGHHYTQANTNNVKKTDLDF
jgi:hypothetical protein